MLKAIVLACCLAAVSHGDADAEAKAQFGGYPFPGGYQGGYPITPYHQPQPSHGAVHETGLDASSEANQRILWGQLFNLVYKKSTVFVTSSFIFTCTQSTTACAAGRRRRAVLSDLLEEEQFEEKISPSAVAAIEPTASVDSIRESREADPQFYYNPHYTAGLDGSYPVSDDLNRQIGGAIPGANLIFKGRTIYFTSVVIVISTFTSIPACSVSGTLAQCPALG
jgi:hypothetical protein